VGVVIGQPGGEVSVCRISLLKAMKNMISNVGSTVGKGLQTSYTMSFSFLSFGTTGGELEEGPDDNKF
jgi:hypothetical protein